jgi:glycosyltransferase involved in cell wall biosynthesis/peptidoglycan/xylan/chitin deacetylase (PgdA/CDA1 family)
MLHSRIPVVVLGKRPGIDVGIVAKLVQLFRRERPHIVHSHNWATFLYAVVAAKLTNVPVLIHGEHGYEDHRAASRRLGTKRFLAQMVTRLTTVSASLERLLIENWNVPPERVTFIPNGIDLDRFPLNTDSHALRREFGLRPEHRVITSIGRYVPVKDFPMLIRAFARVHAGHPQSRLLIMGSGERSDLIQLAGTLGIKDSVLFPGVRLDVPAVLAMTDVYVNSSHLEGMSNTILEAMASARPVVATDVGGNPELVREGETGFLVPSGDDAALAARVSLLLENDSLRATMGNAARKVVERNHPLTRTIDAYNNMYLESMVRRDLRVAQPAPQVVRRAAARALRYSGLTWIRGATARNSLTILAYHRVLPLQESLLYPFQSMVMPRDLFEQQMSHLRQHYTMLTLLEAVERLRENDLPPRSVCVTFDDGYRDNFDVALPILKKYGVPATFFVVTGVMEGKSRLLWDEVVSRVRQIKDTRGWEGLRRETMSPWLNEKINALSAGEPAETIGERLVRDMNRVSLHEREAALEVLRNATIGGAKYTDPPLVSWDELREMRRAGMLIGAHTVTHPFLDELDHPTAKREIEGSIATLTERLDEPITLFSYPRGRFKEEVKTWLQDAGVEAAVTTELGRNSPGTDPYALRRFDAGYCRIHAGPDTVLLDVEIQGWFQPLREGYIPS